MAYKDTRERVPLFVFNILSGIHLILHHHGLYTVISATIENRGNEEKGGQQEWPAGNPIHNGSLRRPRRVFGSRKKRRPERCNGGHK
jgi:hypothetical protein